MPFTVQVTIDCSEPHTLADWWAETLGWQVESPDPALIRRMIDEGRATEVDTMTHRGSLVWRVGAAVNSPGPQQLRLLFQRVPEPKTVKNRLHFDVRTQDADPEAVRARLVERGATVLHTGQQGPFSWVTMADPEGNEFCV